MLKAELEKALADARHALYLVEGIHRPRERKFLDGVVLVQCQACETPYPCKTQSVLKKWELGKL